MRRCRASLLLSSRKDTFAVFERELVDGRFVYRWGIVRLIRQQSIAEHSHLVTLYANDIATYLDLPENVRLAVALYAPWHDIADEIFTGDLPGPNKRALLDDGARRRWDERTEEWAAKTFPEYLRRSGQTGLLMDGEDHHTVKLIVKVADWLEAAVAMATETQLGNQCTRRHILPSMQGAIETAHQLCDHLKIGKNYGNEVPFTKNVDDAKRDRLIEDISAATFAALDSQSKGPWIAKEDAEREGRHDPCLIEPK
jgi:5'-deoxynucleotidase YfbR-like HD superfamily hydrolase